MTRNYDEAGRVGPERIAAQCRNVAPFAEKNICWEALYFHL